MWNRAMGRVMGVMTMLLLLGVGPRVGFAAAATFAATDNAGHRAAASLYGNIRSFVLPNGLHVYLKPIPRAQTVTTMVAYRVGSADEDNSCTGLSHYLEHLMFKGTAKFMPGDIDRLTLQNGGANNAYTDTDYTIFHFDFASDRWDTALDIEADRMQNLRIDHRHEFEKEKGAVIQELRRDEDEPWDLEFKAILPLLFGNGPYGHPVIGRAKDVRDATAAVIKAYYDRWYHPNNASLVIVGGFDPDKAQARITELFGPIPRVNLPARRTPLSITRDHPARTQIDSKFASARLLMGYNSVRVGDPDDVPLDVLAQVLVGDKTGRLYTRLVEQEKIANSVGSFDNAGRYPGWFAVMVELLPGHSIDHAEQITLQEIQKLADEPVSAAELARAKRSIIAGQIFGQESVHGLANSIAQSVARTHLDYLRTYLTKVAAVTPAEVQAAAKKYLDPNRRVVVRSIPAAEQGAGPAAAPVAPHRADSKIAAAPAPALSLKNARRVVLDNGLTLLLLENHRLPIVAAAADVKDVHMLEAAHQVGVAQLTGRLLDEGTAHHTGPEIAQTMASVGGSLAMNASGGSVQVLAPDWKLGLSLLGECLIHPTFPDAQFTREKQRQLSDLQDAREQPEYRARQAFRAAIYGNTPLGRPSLGEPRTVEPLTPADCRRFHDRVFVPSNTLLAVVGDFNSDDVIAEVRRITADWKPAPVPVVAELHPAMPAKFTQDLIRMPAAAQLHLFMGHPGVRRNNHDYYKLLVMDYVLGTGPGFTDRLTARIRDREGLAYTVYGNITASAGTQPGVFTCYVGTEPQNFERVKREFIEEIQRLQNAPPTDSEVRDAEAYLTGSLPFRFSTDATIAGQLLTIERYGLSFDDLHDFRKAVNAVTPADVQAMAKKYLHPDRMVLVAAGAIDAEGHALAPAEQPGGAAPSSAR